uniref:Uncharacterized protein n=1 Tax=Tetraselmis sp. GSL018 TaxID=582737 RepID=A0A061RKP6_9CHLO
MALILSRVYHSILVVSLKLAITSVVSQKVFLPYRSPPVFPPSLFRRKSDLATLHALVHIALFWLYSFLSPCLSFSLLV